VSTSSASLEEERKGGRKEGRHVKEGVSRKAGKEEGEGEGRKEYQGRQEKWKGRKGGTKERRQAGKGRNINEGISTK
jgi:hypothetical protein